jgi:D-alanyl-D-alanine carboxypeptidase
VLHAYDAERGTYEESTFWNPSWTTAKGAVMTTDICDLATSVVLGGWVLQNPAFFGYGGVQAYLPSASLSIATEATVDKDAEVGINGGMMVFEEIASELAPGHSPSPEGNRRRSQGAGRHLVRLV